MYIVKTTTVYINEEHLQSKNGHYESTQSLEEVKEYFEDLKKENSAYANESFEHWLEHTSLFEPKELETDIIKQ